MALVLVTGATGALGQRVVSHLLAQGNTVLALGHKRRLSIRHDSLIELSVNLWADHEVANFFKQYNPKCLIHLAWEATPGKFWHSENNFAWVAASANLLQKFVQNGGQRAVIAGTCAEYKWGLEPLDDRAPELHPTTYYSSSKVAFHTLAKTICNDISFAWGRIFFPFSPNEDPKRLVRYIADNIKSGIQPIIGVPDRAIDLMHLDDVAKVFALLAIKYVEGDINICRGKAIGPYEIAQVLASLCGNDILERHYADLVSKTQMTACVSGTSEKRELILPQSSLISLNEGLLEFL